MTGQGKKTQTNTQRSTKVNSRSQTDDKDLKRQLSELKSKYEQEHKQNILLQATNEKLRQQNIHLQNQIDVNKNKAFLHSLSVSDDAEHDEAEHDDDTRPAKRQMRKKPSDEEEKAKTLMKTLLKTLPELDLKDDETFKSKANTEICQKLIPRLQKEMKAHNPSYEQLEIWLQSLHRNRRSTFLKANQPNQSNSATVDDELDDENESDDATRPAKRQMKSKGKKPVDCSEDEIDEGAKTLMKTLLKIFPPELNLKYEDTFKSKTNTEILQNLVPKLLKEVKPGYNLSYEQVEAWLQTWHRNRRSTFLKSNQMMVD